MQQKILVIGSKGHTSADCIGWDCDTLPNLVDYHLIIVNVRTFDDTILKKISHERLKEFRALLSRFLYSRGQLIVLTDFHRSIRRPKDYPENVDNYDWCPIVFGIEQESGDTKEVIEKRFSGYLSNFKKWSFYFFMPRGYLTREIEELIGSTYDIEYELSPKIFIQNRYSRMLCGSYGLYISLRNDHQREKKRKILGEIVLLPLIEELESEKAVSLVLEDLTGVPQVSPPPDWLTKVGMPFVNNYISEKMKQEEVIAIAQSRIEDVQKKSDELNEYKKLLYADGSELENIFRKCLEKLGGKIVPSKYSNEEYILECGGKEHLVEVKGVSKSLALNHVRQLIDYLLKYEEETRNRTIGILFGNAYKNTPTDLRNKKTHPTFPANVVDRAQEIGICLVPSVEFFEVFCRFLEDPKIAHKILDRIVETRGIVTFSGI